MGLFDEIDKWGRTSQPKQSVVMPGPEVLPGNTGKGQTYQCEIIAAALEEAHTNPPKPVFSLTIRVCAGPYEGIVFKRTDWFGSEEKLNWLSGEFMTLGIDTRQWGKTATPWSRCLRAACQAIVGLRFIGSRRDSEDGKFQNLNIVARAGMGGAPASAPAPLFEAPPNGAAVPAGDIKIPF
jgi:hypothetical protein